MNRFHDFASGRGSGIGQAGKHHQVDVATGGMAPFAEFLSQGLVVFAEALILEILQALMHLIEGVVNQFGGLFRCHGQMGGCRTKNYRHFVDNLLRLSCSSRHTARALWPNAHAQSHSNQSSFTTVRASQSWKGCQSSA